MRSAAAEAKATIISNPDRDPLNYLVSLANDETVDRADRITCAKIVLPYLHPQLSVMTIDAVHRNGDSERSTEDLQRELEQLEAWQHIARLAPPPEVSTVKVDAEPAVAVIIDVEDEPEEAARKVSSTSSTIRRGTWRKLSQ